MRWFDRSLRAQSCVVSEYRCFDIIVEPTRGSANDAGLEIITSVTKFRTTDLKHSAVCHVSKVQDLAHLVFRYVAEPKIKDLGLAIVEFGVEAL